MTELSPQNTLQQKACGSSKVRCADCSNFKRGSGSDHALGICGGRPRDGHKGQWPYARHRCRDFHPAATPDLLPERGIADVRFYVSELRSTECSCGREKKSGYSFCYPCWMSLPKALRAPLHRKVGEGYEEAYEAARLILQRKEKEV